MKKNQSFPIVILFFTAAFTSCKKYKIVNNNTQPPSSTIIDSNYLSRIYYAETDAGLTEIFETVTYVYDNDKG